VAAAGNDQTMHVVGGQLHRARGPLADAFRSADGQDGQGQPPFLALLVLRDGGIERTVGRKGAAQGVGIGGEQVYVVADGLIGQFPRGLGELEAEVHVRPSLDELFRPRLGRGRTHPQHPSA
jgi:hypothetical protein